MIAFNKSYFFVNETKKTEKIWKWILKPSRRPLLK